MSSIIYARCVLLVHMKNPSVLHHVHAGERLFAVDRQRCWAPSWARIY